MDNSFPTTPGGVSQTPCVSVDLPAAIVAGLRAFDRCMALTRAAVAADACADAANQDPALARCDTAAADAWAVADDALETFYFEGPVSLAQVKDAAWVLLLLFQDDGQDLAILAQRSRGLRYWAGTYARSPLAIELAAAPRLIVAADLVDAIIAAALEDFAQIEALRASPVGTAVRENGSDDDLHAGPF
ncbi:hypothetical protein [Loktanella sp. SALINAS62]|uniref:hypothetical protein n=1 Tax=Loktanella sp. SALINAS62 TaxID=2706124 RepID=UPI001B8CE765|nr:hypothetical protein [Loktanella sp. SALINAS62]MBS1301993.1 hypothetical protein [Loktanella sp. SALINAS62]